jgi:hypothetical protein
VLRQEITNLSLFHALSTLSLRGRSSLPILPDLRLTETIDEVIVYHSSRLHVGAYDRTNETESAKLKILAERIGFDEPTIYVIPGM